MNIKKFEEYSPDKRIVFERVSSLQLHHLVEVSNNSHLTQDVFKIIEEKLSSDEQNDFLRWLDIIKQNSSKANKRFF